MTTPNLTRCNNCGHKIVLSLNEHYRQGGLCFCCEECAHYFFSPNNLEGYPSGLAYDLGVEDGG